MVFSTCQLSEAWESMKEFYARMNRAAYMVIEGGVQDVLNTNRSIDLMKDVGVVIEPLSDDPVLIPANPTT